MRAAQWKQAERNMPEAHAQLDELHTAQKFTSVQGAMSSRRYSCDMLTK